MVNPQGTQLIDTQYFTNLTAEVNGLNVCADLQAFIARVMASLQAEITSIENQIAALIPLIVVPTSLAGCISWIEAQIAPYLKQYEAYIAQLTATLKAIQALAAAIEGVAARIVGCVATVPAMVVAGIAGAGIPPGGPVLPPLSAM